MTDAPTAGIADHGTHEDERGTGGTKALARAMLVLRLIARHEVFGVRLTQLTALTGIPHPTVRRVLKCLIDERLVVQDVETRKYRLGPMNFELGLATLHEPEYTRRFHPLLQAVHEATGDTVFFSVRAGVDTVCLDKVVAAPYLKAAVLEVGGRRPLGYGSAGVALLAYYADAEIQEIMAYNKRSATAYRRMNEERIWRGIEQVRSTGFVIQRDYATIGITALGMAIPSPDSLPKFAFSVSSVNERMTKAHIDEVKEVMKSEVKRIADVTEWPF